MAIAALAGCEQIVPVAGDQPATGTGLGDGGNAHQATLLHPTSVAVDTDQNVVIADNGANRVRLVAKANGTFYGQQMSAGEIETIAGNGQQSGGGDGGPALDAAITPWNVATDSRGDLIINDRADANGATNRMRVVPATSRSWFGLSMVAGDIYTVAGGLGPVESTATDFGGCPQSAPPASGAPAVPIVICAPFDPAVDADGNLLIPDAGFGLVEVVAGSTGTFYGQAMTAGDIYRLAGAGPQSTPGTGIDGPALSAGIVPDAVAIDKAGNVVVSSNGMTSLNGSIEVLAESTGTFYQRAMVAGDVYQITGSGSSNGTTTTTNPADQAADETVNARQLVVDPSGNLVFVLYNGAFSIDMIAESYGTFYSEPMAPGELATVATLPGEANDIAVDGSGNIYTPDAFKSVINVVQAVPT